MNFLKFSDFKLIAAILVTLCLLPFVNLEKENISSFIIFMFLDLGHFYSSFIETFFDRSYRKKIKIIFYSIFSICLNLAITYLFPGKFFIYIFYLVLFHYFWQGYWLDTFHLNRNLSDRIVYWLTILPAFLFLHFRDLKLGDDFTYAARPIDISTYIKFDFFTENIFMTKLLIGLFILTTLSIHFLKSKKININLISHAFLFYLALVAINNPYWSMAILAIAHTVSFLPVYIKRIKMYHSNEFVRKFSIQVIFLFLFSGAFIEANIEDGAMYFPNHLNNLAYAMAFFPISLHVIFDFFEMRKSNNRMKNLDI